MTKTACRLFDEAERKRAASRFPEAIALFLEAKRLSAQDRELRADCAFSLGDAYRMTGEFARAVRCYKEAEKLSLALDSEMRSFDALVGLGLTLRAMGDFKEAAVIFNRCMRWYKKSGDKAGIAFTLWARAGALRIKGDLAGAIKGFKEAKAMFAKLSDKSGAGYCLTGLGGASRVAGRPGDSFKYYTGANKVFRGLKDTFGVAYSYCGIANSLRMKGDFKASLAYFKKAASNYRKIGDRVSYAYTLWGEGSGFQMLGRDRDALGDFKEARRLFKETGDKRGLLYCMISISQLMFKVEQEKASALISGALRAAKKLGLKTEEGYARSVIKAMKKGGDALPLNLA
ncbi:MAG: tetratricopeptide repeat protein [Deltaproteobacteria bacterium]|nr:tetratricopeptide repeat protein [Deltaproteobacteria bacterium]